MQELISLLSLLMIYANFIVLRAIKVPSLKNLCKPRNFQRLPSAIPYGAHGFGFSS